MTRLTVVSDTHLGEGPGSSLEDFKVDREFSQLVGHLMRRQQRSRKLRRVAVCPR